jgi:hypothetical protein
MKIRTLLVAGIVTGTWIAGTLCLGADVTAGTWKLNAAKSKSSPGATRYETITIAAAGADMKITLEGTNGAGAKIKAAWTGKYDGKDYPITGNPETDTLSYTKVDDHNFKSTIKKGGKTVVSGTIVYSADGKTRTVTTSGTNAKGEKVSSTAVYEKK